MLSFRGISVAFLIFAYIYASEAQIFYSVPMWGSSGSNCGCNSGSSCGCNSGSSCGCSSGCNSGCNNNNGGVTVISLDSGNSNCGCNSGSSCGCNSGSSCGCNSGSSCGCSSGCNSGCNNNNGGVVTVISLDDGNSNFLVCTLLGAVFAYDPVVETKYGTIVGSNVVVPSGQVIEFFTGIPFAKPPVGDLRFEKPVPPDPWETPLVAKSFGEKCIQFLPVPGVNTNASENCLFLNIARPSNRSSDPQGYPVLVWIYGGGFTGGSSQLYHNSDANERIVSRGIIFVSLNYRLGPLGFFATKDPFVPGNYGLWDQVQALKFLKEVIQPFGGNPEKITISGASAGGASVSWLTYSEVARGLFQKVIPMCGCSHANWAQNFEGNEKSSLDLLEKTNCSQHQNPKECLKTKSLEEITSAAKTESMMLYDSVNLLSWSPNFDRDLIQSTNFSEINENIDYLYTINSQEDIPFSLNMGHLSKSALHYPVQCENASFFGKSEFEVGIRFLLSENGAFGSESPRAIQKVIDFYENQTVQYSHDQFLQSYVQLFSDLHFNVPLLRETKAKGYGNNVYIYVHDYVTLKNKNVFLDGSGHCMDVSYICGNFFGTEDLSDPTYVKIKDQVLEIIENFVKNGIPKTEEISFNKVEKRKIPFVHIGSESLSKENLWTERLRFWDNIMKEFGFDWVSGKWTGTEAM
ncbi:hypothetical protein FO519_007527 [Halicephalobus sp. NKZ332]|nr:hypothetical protein FO519_007527 [Halicephalobus sp. NKZ332]